MTTKIYETKWCPITKRICKYDSCSWLILTHYSKEKLIYSCAITVMAHALDSLARKLGD